jgi:hypothetical protein
MPRKRTLRDLSPLTPEPDPVLQAEHPAALENNLEEVPTIVEPSKPTRRKGRKAATKPEVTAAPINNGNEDEAPPAKRARRTKLKANLKEDDEKDVEEEEKEKPKRKRKPKVVEPIVYDITPVEQKTTNFRGRLGYVRFSLFVSSVSHPSII